MVLEPTDKNSEYRILLDVIDAISKNKGIEPSGIRRKEIETFKSFLMADGNAENPQNVLNLSNYHLRELFCFRNKKSQSIKFLNSLQKGWILEKKAINKKIEKSQGSKKDELKKKALELKENIRCIELAKAYLSGKPYWLINGSSYQAFQKDRNCKFHNSYTVQRLSQTISFYANIAIQFEIGEKYPTFQSIQDAKFNKFTLRPDNIHKWIKIDDGTFAEFMFYPYYAITFKTEPHVKGMHQYENKV